MVFLKHFPCPWHHRGSLSHVIFALALIPNPFHSGAVHIMVFLHRSLWKFCHDVMSCHAAAFDGVTERRSKAVLQGTQKQVVKATAIKRVSARA